MFRPQFMVQKNMLRVLYALVPVALLSVYYFGWRTLAILATCAGCALVTEAIMAGTRKGKVSTACFVTAVLYGLSLPPTVPLWIAGVGAVIAILFAKEVFGGFGKNLFNPAIVGRAFVYVCFPLELTSRFVPVFSGFPGGFVQWSFTSLKSLPTSLAAGGNSVTDAVSAATPLLVLRDFHQQTDLVASFFGSIASVFQYEGFTRVLSAGSMGEVCVPLLIACGVYLIVTRTANWRLMAGTLAGAMATAVVFRYFPGGSGADPIFMFCTGGLVYAAVFMVTDPVSAPKLPLSQWIYSLFFGIMIIFFRRFSVFAEGIGFALLLANMIAPSLDLWITRAKGALAPAKKVSA